MHRVQWAVAWYSVPARYDIVIIHHLVVLPLLEGDPFGLAVTPAFAMGTLVRPLIYGGPLDRHLHRIR